MCKRASVLFLMLVLGVTHALAAEEAGEVVAARGAITAQQGEGTPRILGRSAKVNVGDVVTTGKKSFVVMKLGDGTKMTLRPNTSFKIEQWNEKPQQESAVFRLFKGGLRAISGALAKRRPDAFRLRTSVATIGIRGTVFGARLCEDDCRVDAKKYKEVKANVSPVVGRVGFLKGSVDAARPEAGLSRSLSTGAPVYAGDSIITEAASYAVVLFKDRSRVTIRPNSEFAVTAFDYQDKDTDNAIFRLVRGGLRAVTGLMGERRPNKVKYRTAVATIGIRGTAFDMFCQQSCESETDASTGITYIKSVIGNTLIPAAYAATPSAPGLIVAPWADTVIVQTPSGEIEVTQGQIILVPADGSPPIFLPELPSNIREPKPEEVELDEELLLAVVEPQEAEKGLYLACHEGHCLMGEVSLGGGETAYKGEGSDAPPVRFEIIPQFLAEDPYFKTVDLDGDVLEIFDFTSDPENLECTVGG